MRFLPLLVAACWLSLTCSLVAQAPSKPPKDAANTPAPKSPGESATPSKSEYPKEIAGESLEQWMKKLKSRDASERDAAVRVIPYFGEPAKKALPTIISMVSDSDHTVRVTAMYTATGLKDYIEDSRLTTDLVNRLKRHIEFSGGIMRMHACVCVQRMAWDAVGCIPGLIAALKDTTSYETRKFAAQALGIIGRPMSSEGPNLAALTALVRRMDDSSVIVRIEVLQSLIMLGPHEELYTEQQAMVLSRLKTENDPKLQIWLRVLLMSVDPKSLNEQNIGIIAKQLKVRKVRITAAEALGFMGKTAKSRVFELMEGLKSDKDEDVAFLVMCTWALGCMGNDARAAIPELEKLAKHKNAFIKLNAQQCLDIVTGKKTP